MLNCRRFAPAALLVPVLLTACAGGRKAEGDLPPWEADNPLRPLPRPPLGIESKFSDLAEPPTPERVRLGRWLFYDPRLSANGEISCASCHEPQFAFSETKPVSIGIRGLRGTRKAPSFVNQAWTPTPGFFWDGRASTLEEQSLGPIVNPVEMGNSHQAMIRTLNDTTSYRRYFLEAFGTEEINVERVAKAIADYERTRMSGNSPWDRWKNGDTEAISEAARKGTELFFGKAACNQCHLGQNFTDGEFHNLGIGWNSVKGLFSDEGRYLVTRNEADLGAFKTPSLREVGLRPPYMHDGSIATLRDAVLHYNKGGTPNPYLSPKVTPLGLTASEIDALVEFMLALNGEGYQDRAPAHYPR